MYSGERHINKGNAMRHNEQVEQARQAEHLRRCAESPAYERVYKRWLKMNGDAMQQTATTLQVISDQMCQQKAQSLSDSMKPKPIKLRNRPDPIPPPGDLQRLTGCGSPWTWFLLGMMFADEDKLKQMREDAVASQEMMKVNERYDRQIIHMSGFEW